MSNPTRYALFLFVFGLIYIGLIPPLQTPDAQTHLYRAYQVSSGEWIAEKRADRTGGEIPASLTELWGSFAFLKFKSKQKSSLNKLLNSHEIQLEPEKIKFVGFENTAVFSPIPYLPSTAGIIIGKQFSSSVLSLYYFASITSLIFSVGLIYLAMQQVPKLSGLVLMICLLPMQLNLMASISADGLSNALSILFVMLIIRHATTPKAELPVLNLSFIIVLGILVALSKQTYAALLLFPLIIPIAQFNTTRHYIQWFLLYGIMTAIALFGWAYLSSLVYSPLSWLSNTDPEKQLTWVMHNVPAFAQIAYDDLALKWTKYSLLMAGARLGWEDTALPFNLMWAILIASILMALVEATKIQYRGRSMLILILGILITTLGISIIELALYMHANAYHSGQILGVHGRYFILYFLVFILTISIALSRLFRPIVERFYGILHTGLLSFSFITISCSLFYIYQRYYVI